MASKLTPVQVRYTDPRINTYLDILSKANNSMSKSKLLETLSKEPIERAFKAWLIDQRASGATYSELCEVTEIPVPELMEMIEPSIELNEQDIENHLTVIGNQLGIDFKKVWAEIPVYKLGPM